MPRSKIVRYQASSPNAKYLGANLKALTDNLKGEVTQPIMQKFNLEQIDPSEWHNAQIHLDALREIEARCTFEELVAVGIKTAEFFPLPPEIDSMEKFLEASPQMAQLFMRDTDPAEGIRVEKLSNTHYRMILNLPLPPCVMYGGTYGMLKRVKKPHQVPVIVITDDSTPYIFDVTWDDGNASR